MKTAVLIIAAIVCHHLTPLSTTTGILIAFAVYSLVRTVKHVLR